MTTDYLALLKAASALDSDEDFENFCLACRELRYGRDSSVLGEMIRCLTDADAGEIQYELIEACESFPDDVFVQEMFKNVEVGYSLSPFWFDLMFCSMLNTEKLFDLVKREASKDLVALDKINALVANGEVNDGFSEKWRKLGPK